MTYIKIGDTLYSASVSGQKEDRGWGGRASKAITLEMTYEEAIKTFINGLPWSIVTETTVEVENTDEEGNVTVETVVETNEFDNSEYSLAGDLTDHRDGTITVKMGKLTELEEAYEILLGGI